MRTPRLPVVDRTNAPANLNGLVRFAERQNLVSARVPSRFKFALTLQDPLFSTQIAVICFVWISEEGIITRFCLFPVTAGEGLLRGTN